MSVLRQLLSKIRKLVRLRLSQPEQKQQQHSFLSPSLQTAPLPDNEAERLKKLEKYKILNTPHEEAFDDLTKIAAHICGSPISLISLIDADRQWFKSKVGLDVDETPREQAFCAHAILNPDEVMIVPNALEDERFAENPLVTSDPNIRFYAGTPLVTPDGFPLGTLCVLDRIPRHLSEEQLETLRALGRQAIYQMELQLTVERLERQILRRREAEAKLKVSDRQIVDLLETMTDGFFALDKEWRFTYLNQRAGQILERKQEEVLGRTIWKAFPDVKGSKFDSEYHKAVEEQVSVTFEEYYPSLNRWFEVRAFPSFQGLSVFLHDITSRKGTELALRKEKEKTENLLLNIFPQPIVEKLKREPGIIAQRYEEATILFADLVNFTQLASEISPKELVLLLNKIFCHFDDLTDKYNLEKIKTIGDAYMVAGGLPEPQEDHGDAIAQMALDMRQSLQEFNIAQGMELSLSIGIHSGPVVAGVISRKKFSYDLWGDTVNLASRMQSHCLAGKIQVTEATYKLLQDKFVFEERGMIEVKGKGKMKTYLLQGRL